VARIKWGLQEKLSLGNLEARRDWGYAKDYVQAMWLMLQREEPSDYVIATGRSHSVLDFARMAFDVVGLSADDFVVSDPDLLRPTEVDHLRGNPCKAVRELGWDPNRTPIEELVRIMVDADLQRVEEEIRSGRHAHKAVAAHVLTHQRE
jgi:GDPmannose 4,6-dehydratase